MPLEQAEKVLLDYTPEQLPEQEVPAALVELHEKIQDKTAELTDEYVESLPKDENGETVWPKAEEERCSNFKGIAYRIADTSTSELSLFIEIGEGFLLSEVIE